MDQSKEEMRTNLTSILRCFSDVDRALREFLQAAIYYGGAAHDHEQRHFSHEVVARLSPQALCLSYRKAKLIGLEQQLCPTLTEKQLEDELNTCLYLAHRVVEVARNIEGEYAMATDIHGQFMLNADFELFYDSPAWQLLNFWAQFYVPEKTDWTDIW